MFRALIAYETVDIIHPYLLCNRYQCTAVASRLPSSNLGLECCKFLGLNFAALPQVVLLYSRLVSSRTLKQALEYCKFPEHSPPFDLQRFIAFGLLNDIIRRVQAHVWIPEKPNSVSGGSLYVPSKEIIHPYVAKSEQEEKVKKTEVSLDQYIVENGLPLDEEHYLRVLDMFIEDPNIVVIWK